MILVVVFALVTVSVVVLALVFALAAVVLAAFVVVAIVEVAATKLSNLPCLDPAALAARVLGASLMTFDAAA